MILFQISQRCENRDPCMPNPCNNGQCISQGSNSFICQCPIGFTGKFCETCDPCTPNPCQAGQCVSQGTTYFCQCPPGYSGQRFDSNTILSLKKIFQIKNLIFILDVKIKIHAFLTRVKMVLSAYLKEAQVSFALVLLAFRVKSMPYFCLFFNIKFILIFYKIAH